MSTAQFVSDAAYFGPEDNDLVIRSFRESDQSATTELLRTGLLVGHIDPIEAATELARTERKYLAESNDHTWVAEMNQSVVGMVAVAQDHHGIAHLRRLRVSPQWQADSRIAVSLVQHAADHARENGCLKLIFYTPSTVSEQSSLCGILASCTVRTAK